jgi:hypothetical protein
MADKAQCSSEVKIGNTTVDVERMTQQLEQGHTRILESALGAANSKQERTDILNMVQGINAKHRLESPDLPKLKFQTESDWPSSWGENMEIIRSQKGKKDQFLYVEVDYDDKKERRVVERHP